MGSMIRAARKGGSVAHLMRAVDAPSVCGRVMALVPGGEGLRLCKTCARITGVQADIDTRTQDGLPVVSDWTPEESAFIKGANDSFTLGMCREVLSQFETSPEDYSAPRMLRHVAMMRAALSLHTGRDYRDPVDTAAPSMQRRQGDGMVNPNSKSVARSILTDNQRNALTKMSAFSDALIKQIRELEGKECPDLSPIGEEFFAKLTTRKAINDAFTNLSASIDKLKAKRDELKRNAPRKPVAEKQEAAEDGYYVKGDTFVCVKWNRAGTGQYATVWDGASWEYDRNQSYRLVQEVKGGKLTPMTPEDAKRFGDLYGSCFKCSRTLTDPESIAQGYGPICAGRMGW